MTSDSHDKGLERVAAELRPGLSVYLQGAIGEPLILRDLLSRAPDLLSGVAITGCLLPGMNEFDYAALHPGARLTTLSGVGHSPHHVAPERVVGLIVEAARRAAERESETA